MSRARPPVVVVGAGLAGVSCARVLHDAGVPVRVLDRGRRVGGRMASRRVDGRPVDLGASYVTVSDPGFAAVVERWESAGLARPWTDTFAVAGGEAKAGPLRWGSGVGLRALVEDLADGLDVTSERTVAAVRRVASGLVVDGEPAAAVVLAMPDPQAERLLDDDLRAERPAPVAYEAVLALVARWPQRVWDFDGLFVNDHPVLGWVADDGARRGDGAPVLVAHSTSPYAAEHLADPAAAATEMVAALRDVAGLGTDPTSTLVHRWSFARPVEPHGQPYALVDGLGLCGDQWSDKPRVEAAWLSGRALGSALVGRLG